MSNYGSLDTKIDFFLKIMCNTSRDIIRHFSTVPSEDPVVQCRYIMNNDENTLHCDACHVVCQVW